MRTAAYPGGELELFREAHHWKRYLAGQVAVELRGDVLEVGAGIGGMTRVLRNAGQASWLALEPDRELAARICAEVRAGRIGAPVEVRVGTLADLAEDARFDTLLYSDVLEHIGEDARELARAAALLRPGGSLIVIAPAHLWLYSEFDRAVGHQRRYTAESLLALRPPGMRLRRLRYLDSVGMLASLANRWLLRHPLPTARQIATWDRLLVPLSRGLDPLLGYRVGKTLLAIWSAPG
jgi:cyclopropane fatty-acyl-phospholipid synthase-like methyltransferase